MKLSVSNIAWNNDELKSYLILLRNLGCDGVEIAPSRIWKEPVNAKKEEIEHLKRLVKRCGLSISAFHALLYNKPNFYLFGDESIRRITVSYLKNLIKLAGRLSTGILVYGSPKSRKIGDNNYDRCYRIAMDTFRDLAREAEKYDVCFCIEPLGPSESDFIQTAEEGYQLVRDVDSPGFGLHLDVKAMLDSKEDFSGVFEKYASMLKHFHISDPGLAPPGYTGLDHRPIGKALFKSGYDGFVSIEMKEQFAGTQESVKAAVKYVQERYIYENRQ